MNILGIESSCDETAAAVLRYHAKRFTLRSSVVASQIATHRRYGGVVPEVAARTHVKHILPVIAQALRSANITPKKIDRIAVTVGPGLITSLQVGVQTARTLAMLWDKPIYPINHLAGHLYSPWLENRPIHFPAVALIVSGGHTELILLRSAGKVKKIGQTIDDAAGEAFDKVSHMLKLGYPGGPAIAKLATHGNPQAFAFPRASQQN